MKLSAIQDHLARGLAIVGHAVATRNTLPILSNVYLGTEDGGLRLVATNLDIAITHWVPAKVEEKGSTTIPARLLADVVNGLPNEKIDLSLPATSERMRKLEEEGYLEGVFGKVNHKVLGASAEK